METVEKLKEVLKCIVKHIRPDGEFYHFTYKEVEEMKNYLKTEETVEVLQKVKKEISEIKLTSWDYDNHLYRLDGETIRNKAVKIIDKYLLGEVEND